MEAAQSYVYLANLAEHNPIPPNGILSTTLQNDAQSKVIQFVFAPGQELSAHTAPYPAMLYFAAGEADLQLGEDQKQAAQGTFVHMPARLSHGIKARTEVVMLLILLRGGAS